MPAFVPKGAEIAAAGALAMDERFYLQKAQEAEAIGNASKSEIQRRQWEEIAQQYRLLIVEAAKLRKAAREIEAPGRN